MEVYLSSRTIDSEIRIALGAVDDEGAFLGHDGEVAHEDLGLLDLARLLDGETGVDPQRRRIGHVPGAALLLVELGLPEGVVDKAQLVVLAGVVGDGVDLIEELLQSLTLEPIEGFELGLDEIPYGQHLGDAAVRIAASSGKKLAHTQKHLRAGAGIRPALTTVKGRFNVLPF
jgi:hypothetical protein